MVEERSIFVVIHLLSTLLMAAPFYMLVIVNERGRFGAPLGYYTDRYMENIIRNNAVRCFIFQGTMAASGLALIYYSPVRSWSSLVNEPAMVVKWVALLILVSLLSYIHFYLQPRIEVLINQLKPDEPAPSEIGPQLRPLRMRRKMLSGICLFLVLTALIMGIRATFFYDYYLAGILVAVAALYAWRVYRKPVPLGWL